MSEKEGRKGKVHLQAGPAALRRQRFDDHLLGSCRRPQIPIKQLDWRQATASGHPEMGVSARGTQHAGGQAVKMQQ